MEAGDVCLQEMTLDHKKIVENLIELECELYSDKVEINRSIDAINSMRSLLSMKEKSHVSLTE